MRDPQPRTRPVVVTLPAEIDIANAGRIGEELCAAFAPGVGTVIADMTDTRFCDSSGISMLVMAHQKALTNNAELRLVVISTPVLHALTMVRIDHLLPVYPSLADALVPGPRLGELPRSSRVSSSARGVRREGRGCGHVRGSQLEERHGLPEDLPDGVAAS